MSIDISISMNMSITIETYLYKVGEDACDLTAIFKIYV
jgi:hypothetical protein